MVLPAWLNPIGKLIDFGGKIVDNISRRKQQKADNEFKIREAQTNAYVDRIMSNTESDNSIDLITARDKRFTYKDEVVTYTFLIPVFIATATRFIQAWTNGDLTNLAEVIILS